MCEVTVERAKTDANVITRFCNFGRRLRVVIRQGVNGQVGIVCGKVCGNGIDKAQQRAGGATFFVVDCYAVGTAATCIGIVL